jgi:hypothetical protein
MAFDLSQKAVKRIIQLVFCLALAQFGDVFVEGGCCLLEDMRKLRASNVEAGQFKRCEDVSFPYISVDQIHLSWCGQQGHFFLGPQIVRLNA